MAKTDADRRSVTVKGHKLQVPLHRGAESFSFFSHLLGVILAILALIWMIWRAEGAVATTAYAIYGATLIALFTASTLHHAIQSATGTMRSGILRRLDHVSIYLFIAGTYTPVTVLGFSGAWSVSILSVVWSIAGVGILLKLFAPFTPRWITTGIYIAMGWIALVGIKPLLEAFPVAGLMWLLGGGIVYTVGGIGYAARWPRLWPKYVGSHGIWHVMVLIGAALHFVFIVRWVPTAA